MVAVNFCYTALALIRQIHQMARHTGKRTRPPVYSIKSENAANADHLRQIFCWLVLSFCNLLAVGSHILSAYSCQLAVYCCISQPVSGHSLFLYKISQSSEALSLHIADIRQSGR